MSEPDESDDLGREPMARGDEAPPNHPSASENACPDCDGSGFRYGGECETCAGRGVVIEAIGGG
jgi:DnaJ-class molecular chaperone